MDYLSAWCLLVLDRTLHELVFPSSYMGVLLDQAIEFGKYVLVPLESFLSLALLLVHVFCSICIPLRPRFWDEINQFNLVKQVFDARD